MDYYCKVMIFFVAESKRIESSHESTSRETKICLPHWRRITETILLSNQFIVQPFRLYMYAYFFVPAALLGVSSNLPAQLYG